MIYVSMNLTGTEIDIPRAEALRRQIIKEGKAPFLPVLAFRELMVIPTELRAEVLQICINIMQMSEEVRLYDNPTASITCSRDKQLALNAGVAVREMSGIEVDGGFADVMQFLQLQLGGFPPMAAIEDIKYYFSQGFEAAVIKEAIRIGARAGKPWVYINGILRNLLSRGILTEEQMEESRKKKTENNKQDNTAKYDLYEFERRLQEGV